MLFVTMARSQGSFRKCISLWIPKNVKIKLSKEVCYEY